MSHTLTTLPAGFVALGMNGDQTVREVHYRYADQLVSSQPAVDRGAMPWLPFELAATLRALSAERKREVISDQHGNVDAREGCDRCACGCKYWEHDACVDCGARWSLEARDR